MGPSDFLKKILLWIYLNFYRLLNSNKHDEYTQIWNFSRLVTDFTALWIFPTKLNLRVWPNFTAVQKWWLYSCLMKTYAYILKHRTGKTVLLFLVHVLSYPAPILLWSEIFSHFSMGFQLESYLMVGSPALIHNSKNR